MYSLKKLRSVQTPRHIFPTLKRAIELKTGNQFFMYLNILSPYIQDHSFLIHHSHLALELILK